MIKLNTYLNFEGKSEEAFTFYKSVFGGEFSAVHRFKDTEQGPTLSDEEKEKIMHISLPIGNDILMATDTLASSGQTLKQGDNSSISITVDTLEEAERIYKALSEGGRIDMPLEMAFWGEYFAAFADKFGILWMVSFAPKAE